MGRKRRSAPAPAPEPPKAVAQAPAPVAAQGTDTSAATPGSDAVSERRVGSFLSGIEGVEKLGSHKKRLKTLLGQFVSGGQ